MGKIILPNRNIVRLGFNAHVGMEGYYSLRKIDKFSGKTTQEIKPFHNLILNQGLTNYTLSNTYLNGSVATFLAVGTGNTAPAVTDKQLQAWVASTAGISSTVGYVAAASPLPAYWYCRTSYQFSTGVAAGNLSEIGVAPSSGFTTPPINPTTLGSRALIVDVNGNPTTITVLSNEILTATYELRFYLDTTDHSFTVNLNGSPITGVYRLCNITNVASTPLVWTLANNNGAADKVNVYSGDIGPVTGIPSGTQYASGADSSTLIQFVNDIANSGTCYMDRYYTFSTANANDTLKAIQITGVMWNYQFGNLSTPIVKTSGQQFQINYRLSWGRH